MFFLGRGSTAFAGVVALGATLTAAFPTPENLMGMFRRDSANVTEIYEAILEVQRRGLFSNPLTTPIEVTGAHAFKAPNLAGGDQRGPCPGLNALANHGYLPRNGVVSILDVITQTSGVLGMGVDIATLLAIMATVGVGNPLSLNPGFSIAGQNAKSNNLLGNLLGLLGTPSGLQGSHNWIEADASNTRGDLYLTGNAWTMDMSRFEDYYNSVDGEIITMDDVAARAAKTFDMSVATNPNFYFGPYTGLVARNAAYLFSYRLFANYSTAHPQGQLTKSIVRDFFGVTAQPDGTLTYAEGHERIPANWYRMPSTYNLVQLNLDLVDWVLKYPKLGSIGGNMGAVNTFAGVDLGDVTGGLLHAGNLLEGANLFCFAMAAVKTFSPDALHSLFATLQAPLQLLDKALLGPLVDLACPNFEELTLGGTDLLSGLKKQFPGASKGKFAL